MEDAIEKYRQHILRYTPKYWFDELKGKDLACWCPLSQPCHADVLLELVNDGEH